MTRALNTFAAVLLGVVAISVALSPFPGQTVRDLQSADTAPTAVLPGVGAQGAPNIYLVILDGHPRRDALLEITGQDTGAFEAVLRREGLQIAESAHSNYAWTGATLGSMLNFVPIDSLPAGAPAWAPADSSESRQIRNAVNDSAAFSLLRTAGYRVIAVGPPWEHVALRSADEFIDVGYLNSLECHLLSRTALGAVAWAIEPDLIGDRRREGVERSLETLVSVASRDSAQAQFVVVHVPAPHLPVLWDDKGRPVSDTAGNDCAPPGVPGLSGAALRSAYAASLRHLHLLVSQAVAGVVATDEDAVVVVLSDHGARLGEPADELTEGQEWRDTFGVLLAARTPGQPGIVPDDVSLVNLLSILFNAYLEADIPFQANDTQWHDGTPAEAP